MKTIRFVPILVILLTIGIFCRGFFVEGRLPIPSDTIIGLYHPYRDLYGGAYPNGIPFKNFLITDPVRQQYPWRNLAITNLQSFSFPSWNPYTMGGTPLFANFQSAVLYPLNVLFFMLPFAYGWSVLIILQLVLAGIFLHMYLRHLKMSQWSSVFGTLAFLFSGFSISWFEWNTIGHTALWLPLILLSTEKLFVFLRKGNIVKVKEVFTKSVLLWCIIFISSLSFSLFAGHLQTFFYLYVFSLCYFLARWFQTGRKKIILLLFAMLHTCFLLITSVQWISTLQFILHSARNIDQSLWQKEGWFMPYKHLAQFFAPDFFGNPTTLNYFGTWNYGEMVGYLGVFPLLFAAYALMLRRDKRTFFFGGAVLIACMFALPTAIAKLPFSLSLPFFATAQPTRLLFIIDFSLAVLAAFGLDYFYKEKKNILPALFLLLVGFTVLWLTTIIGKDNLGSAESAVAQRNLIFPTVIAFFGICALLLQVYIKQLPKILTLSVILAITIVDLLRFADKFTPFTDKHYLFPSTKITTFLQNDKTQFRVMSTDEKIFPPNFSAVYRVQTIEGYDPLYLQRYAELIAASERERPDITPPFGFNRIITPHNYNSRVIDLLGVKYILSLSDLATEKLEKVSEEGQTKVYRNKEALPRAFFVRNLLVTDNKQQTIERVFDPLINLRETAIIEDQDPGNLPDSFSLGTAEIVAYNDERVVIRTKNSGNGFLVLTDSFYPTWDVFIHPVSGDEGKMEKIHLTNYHFRGVIVPKGEHLVTFTNSVF